MGRQRTPFSWAELIAEGPATSRGRKPKPAAASLFERAFALVQDRERGAGRRGTLDRSEKREAVAASSCDGLLRVNVCSSFLLPIFRWGSDSSSSFALPNWEGDRYGSQEDETHPAPFQRRLKVWWSRASSCPGVVKPPSTGRLTKGEADARISTALCAIANNMLRAPLGRYAIRPRLSARGFSSRAGRQGQTREIPTTGLPSCLARTRSSRCCLRSSATRLERLACSPGISPGQTPCNPRRVERSGTPGAQQLARCSI